jgi:hypothetical protein
MPPAAKSSGSIQHALGLHLHQPAGNLRLLLRQDEAEVGRILHCYDRIARHAHKYAHVARLHLALSVVLLEQLRDPDLIDACRHLADLPAILEGLRSAASIEFIGTGFRHAPLPLIPPDDWDEQLLSERVTIEAVLGRVLKGYWPPASLFTPAMIPALVRAGYEYVLLPQSRLVMPDGSGVDPYRPYRISHESWQIVAVPLDGGFSHAQETGIEAPWFADEVRNGVAQSPPSQAPHLLSTWSDAENGEWFRRLDEEQGFFGHFFAPYMEFCETGEFPVRPVHLSEFLRANRSATQVGLRNDSPDAVIATGPGGLAEDPARERLFRSSARYWTLAKAAAQPAQARAALLGARELILQAEDSALLLGDADHRAAMLGLLDRADQLLDPKPSAAPAPPAVPKPTQAAPTTAKQAAPAAPTAVVVARPQEQPPAAMPQGAVVPSPATSGVAASTAPPVATPTDTAPAGPEEVGRPVPTGPAARKQKGSGRRPGKKPPPRRRS